MNNLLQDIIDVLVFNKTNLDIMSSTKDTNIVESKSVDMCVKAENVKLNIEGFEDTLFDVYFGLEHDDDPYCDEDYDICATHLAPYNNMYYYNDKILSFEEERKIIADRESCNQTSFVFEPIGYSLWIGVHYKKNDSMHNNLFISVDKDNLDTWFRKQRRKILNVLECHLNRNF